MGRSPTAQPPSADPINENPHELAWIRSVRQGNFEESWTAFGRLTDRRFSFWVCAMMELLVGRDPALIPPNFEQMFDLVIRDAVCANSDTFRLWTALARVMAAVSPPDDIRDTVLRFLKMKRELKNANTPSPLIEIFMSGLVEGGHWNRVLELRLLLRPPQWSRGITMFVIEAYVQISQASNAIETFLMFHNTQTMPQSSYLSAINIFLSKSLLTECEVILQSYLDRFQTHHPYTKDVLREMFYSSSPNFRSNRPNFAEIISHLYLVSKACGPTSKTKNLVNVFALLSNPILLKDILLRLHNRQLPASSLEPIVNKLLHVYTQNGAFEEAAELVSVSFILPKSLSSVFVRGNRTHFPTVDSLNLTPSTITYNTLIKLFLSLPTSSILLDRLQKITGCSTALELSLLVLRSMEPDKITYTLLIRHACQSGQMDEAQVFFDRLKEDLFADEIVYNTMISGFCRSDNLVAATEMICEMLLSGVQPTLATFNTMLHAYAKLGDISSVRKWFSRLLAHQTPDSISYLGLLVVTVKNGDLTAAEEIFETLVKTPEMYTCLADGYLTHARWTDCEKKLVEMIFMGYLPSEIIIAKFLDHVQKRGHYATVKSWWRRLQMSEIPATPSVIVIFLDAGGFMGSVPFIKEVFRWARKQRKAIKSENVWNSYIEALSRNGELDFAAKEMLLMGRVRQGVQLPCPSSKTILSLWGFAKGREWGGKKEWMSAMKLI